MVFIGVNLRVKPLNRKELKFLAYSGSHLKMTNIKYKKLVHFNVPLRLFGKDLTRLNPFIYVRLLKQENKGLQ
jgi:hypothetical protein